jgi:SAM-dependent methyltransferase
MLRMPSVGWRRSAPSETTRRRDTMKYRVLAALLVVNQNYAAFLGAIEGYPPYSILDLGCGPGRDLSHFRSLGHEAVGLDGSRQFVAMARSHSQCEVLPSGFPGDALAREPL